MSDFIIAPAAAGDLEELWDYIAQDNIDAADRVRDDIFAAIERLAAQPGMGHLRTDLTDEPLRFWQVRSYLIVYRAESHPLQIVRVLHAARDVKAILGED